jgi:hypothetical protein
MVDTAMGDPGSGEEEVVSGEVVGRGEEWGGRRKEKTTMQAEPASARPGGYCSDLLELILITMVTINVNCPRLVKVSIVI